MKSVSVKFLGSGDAFGSGGRLQTCILIETAGAKFLLDCGASALISMKRFGVSTADIDKILITHLHGDHFGGIPFFILDSQLISKRTRPLRIAGPPGVKDRIHSAMEIMFPGSSRVKQKFEIEFLELQAGARTEMDQVFVTAEVVAHASGSPSYALRIECAGKSIVYSGDTEWTDNLINVAQGADLFIAEAYFYEKKIKFHLDYQTLMEKKAELDCKRIILTHMSDDVLGRLESLELEYASDGTEIIL
jgi:ribonuclease BN (tRNA processing enzyme)